MCSPAMCSVSASQLAKLRPQPTQRHACAAADAQSCSGVGVGGPPPGSSVDAADVDANAPDEEEAEEEGAEDRREQVGSEKGSEGGKWPCVRKCCVSPFIEGGGTERPRWSRRRWLMRTSIIVNGSPVDGPGIGCPLG